MRPGTHVLAVGFIAVLVVGACTGGGGAASAGASGGGGTGTACNPPKQDGVTLSFVSFGGAYQEAQRKAWLEPYTALTGVQFVEDENSKNATIKAQVDAGAVTWDVVDVGNDFGLEAHKDLLEPLDYTLIPKDEVLEGFASTYRVADITYGVVLGYNTEKTGGQVPAGWADFFDTTKFPGKRGTWDYSEGGIFETALMADGVAPDALYPLDLPRAIAKLNTIKDDLHLWTTGAESQELLGAGELVMSLIWNGRAYSAKNLDKKPVEIQWNQQILTSDYFVVPKGSPNKDAAMKFIAWTICADNNAGPSKYIPYGPTNKNSTADPSTVNELSVTNKDENTALFDDEWLVNNYADVDAAYVAWKTE